MTITPTSLAAVNGVTVRNEQFAVEAQVIAQKNVIVGTFDEATFASLSENVPFRIYSPEDCGSKTGFGFMLHRLARAAMKPGIVETWVIPQLEGGSDPDQATGELDFSASADVEAGTIALYIAGDRVAINVTDDATGIAIGGLVADEINDDDELPVTAVDNGDGTVAITSKSGGPWGNDISLDFNLNTGEELPTGVACTVTDMTGGVGTPDIQDALDALGTGDGQNDNFFTNLIHGYGADTATLNAISTYNGVGNSEIGNYKKEIARPFRSLIGDVTADTAGLTAALAFAELRRETDRTNGKLCVPGSQSHPQEIAAQAIGIMAVTNSIRAEEGYIDKRLDGVWYGAVADRWTNDYDNRDAAVKGGVSPTFVKNNVVYLQNVITFYRPESVAVSSNGYRPMRNISIIQNMLSNFKANFEREKWDGISIVEDVTEVSNVTDRLKARDVDAVLDDLVALAKEFAGNAWLYNSSYTIGELQAGDKVTLRSGLTGFDITYPVILSGEGGIFNGVITFDTSIAILTAGGA
jgi:phage tail sheath gpL-like